MKKTSEVDNMKKIVAGFLIITFFCGMLVGYFMVPHNDLPKTDWPTECPEEVSFQIAYEMALNNPEVVELISNKSIRTVTLSKLYDNNRDMNYTQIVFQPQDPNPDDRMTGSRIIVQINDSCMVYSAYETYPSYIPG